MAPPSPQVIAVCPHCHLELYAGQPVSQLGNTATVAHVGCAVDALRRP